MKKTRITIGPIMSKEKILKRLKYICTAVTIKYLRSGGY